MKTLLLIPSVLKTGLEPKVPQDLHPRMDYYALAQALRTNSDDPADLLGYQEVREERHPLVRLAGRFLGNDVALALMGFLRRGRYDVIFTNGENVSIPLALLFKLTRRRPGHVTIGHRLSTGKKQLFFSRLKVQRQIDTLFVYATTQYRHAIDHLKIAPERLQLIAFHADADFYRPLPEVGVDSDQISAAGLEWRDYPTLIEAVTPAPWLKVRLAAASPWSKHTNETERRALPSHVEAKRYEYGELRELYARSSFVVVPLYENDFQAGVTTLLEAMAMGKAVIVTQTTGQTDVVVDGETGLTVGVGDVEGWRRAITRLHEDAALRDRLGRAGRRWVEEHATLTRWVEQITAALRASSKRQGRSAIDAKAGQTLYNPHNS